MEKDENKIEYVKDRLGHDRKYAVNWTKIKNELKWTPAYDFDTNLKNTIIWYQQHKEWWKKIKDGSYKNYYQKQYHQ